MDAGGGLSDAKGVGNVGSSMSTSYQLNYNMIGKYQKQMEQHNKMKYFDILDKE